MRLARLFSLPVLGVLGIIGLTTFSRLYPEFLWFQSFDLDSLWTFLFSVKLKAFLLFFVLSYGFLKLNLWVARRLSARTADEPLRFSKSTKFFEQLYAQYKVFKQNNPFFETGSKLHRYFLEGLLVFLSFAFASSAKTWWMELYAYIYQTPFNVQDPVFFKDIGFYFFTVPLIERLQSFGFGLIFFSLCLVAWIYFTSNILVYLFSKTQRVGFKSHLYILMGLLVGLIAVGAYTDMLGLLYSTDGRVVGAGYADVQARLFGYRTIIGALVIQAGLFFVWAFMRGVTTPIFFSGAVAVLWIVLINAYPGFVQKYVVAPNELQKEKPYIKHNIAYTRMGYGLDKIQEIPFTGTDVLGKADIENNLTTIQNIRLWNAGPLKQTLKQLQEIRLYYEFNHIDIDRYRVDGKLRQVLLSAREMDSSQLTAQAQTWINKHLVYTHGYGLSMVPVNRVTPEGLPELWVKDLPPVSDELGIKITRPEIYFGERIAKQRSSYVITNTKSKEFNYPKGETNIFNHYEGNGGIVLDSIFKRGIYAYLFSDIKLLISSVITSESRLMYDRHIKQIVSKLTPFLSFENDPYLVVSESGRLVWMLDAYTHSNRFPYSEQFNSSINYIRNSVVVTIDAYDGTVQYYIKDQSDPIVMTYSKIFPKLFLPFDQMPADLQQHIRYPRQLFSIQSQMYNTYHMSDPQVFYNREDLWETPMEIYGDQETTMEPYYIVMKVPGEEEESFVMMRPFTPTNKPNMIAWLSASSDLQTYGQLKVFKFPKESLIFGPIQIESRIDQNTEISQKLTLWDQKGSRVIRGNLMIIPINNGIIYAEPVYLQATQSKLPELKRVILAHNDLIVMEPTLEEALVRLIGERIERIERRHRRKSTDGSGEYKTSMGLESENEALLRRIRQEYRNLKQASQKADWTSFGEQLEKLDKLIQRGE